MRNKRAIGLDRDEPRKGLAKKPEEPGLLDQFVLPIMIGNHYGLFELAERDFLASNLALFVAGF